jgi:hypothetical protein
MRVIMMCVGRKAILLLAVSAGWLVVGIDDGLAVDTSVWEVKGAAAFGATETERVAVTAQGTAELAPRREIALATGESYVWSLAPARDGAVYAGTGDGGQIVKVPPKGEGSLVHDSVELEILAIVVGPDGAVYAGGSPDGVILRIADGKAETFFDSPESYVWGLAFGENGDLYAATGDRGNLYRITRDGEGSVVYDSDEVHLLCLLPAPGGRWIVGTSGSGLVLEVTGKGEARVLYDAPEDEVKALARDEAGNLLFAAVGGRGGNGDGPSREEESNRQEQQGVVEVTPGGAGRGAAEEKQGERGRAVIYRQSPTGATTRLWRAPENMILAMEPDGKGEILVGTGDKAAIYRLDARGTANRLVEMSESQVLAIRRTSGGVLIATANPGNIYRFGPDVEANGTITAKPFDAGNVAAWGRLSWQGEHPSGTTIELRTRTGNTEKPDDTWSPWSEPLTDPEGTAIGSPPARFIQWQATLTGSRNLSPQLTRVTVPYRQENLAPRIRGVEVSSSGDRFLPAENDSPDRVMVTLPSGIQAEFLRPGLPPRALRRDEVPWLRDVKVANWVAEDPNGDRLKFDLLVRSEGEGGDSEAGKGDRAFERRAGWSPLAEEVSEQTHAFPTAGLPDGHYRLKVVASDRPSNPETGALADSLDSTPFLVDNTPPRVTALRVQREGKERLTVTVTVTDELSPVRILEYSLDSRTWETVFPEDGLFDAREERFRFEIDLERARDESKRSAGFKQEIAAQPAVFVRAADASGNEAAARAVAP